MWSRVSSLFLRVVLSSFFLPFLGAQPGELVLIFPQIAEGGGSSFEIFLTNPGLSSEQGEIAFFSSSGEPLGIGIDGAMVNTVEFSLPAGGATKIQSDGTGGLRIGYALIYSQGTPSRLSASIGYRLLGNQLSVAAAPASRQYHTVVEVGAGSNTGIAVANPNPSKIAIEAFLVDDAGLQNSSQLVSLGAREQRPQFVTELFNGFKPDEFLGSVHLVAEVPFALVGLKQDADGTLTALSGAPLAYTGNITGSQLVFRVDSGIDMGRTGFSENDLSGKNVFELTGFSKPLKSNWLLIRNVNPQLAVTLEIKVLNDQCEEVLSFLHLLLCDGEFSFDPLRYQIVESISVADRLFGPDGQVLSAIRADQFGSGVFTVLVRAIGASRNQSQIADLLFSFDPGTENIGQCNITPNNVGSNSLLENLTNLNAQPVVFDFLSTSSQGGLFSLAQNVEDCSTLPSMYPADSAVVTLKGNTYSIVE